MRVIAIMVFVCLAACGYRPVAGRMSVDVPRGVRFAPFLVRNDTPELALTHAVSEAARAEIARRGLLAASTDAPGALRLDLRLRAVGDSTASYAPNGTVIEYFGELYIDYDVFAAAATAPIVSARSRRLPFRYDFRANPQDVRIYRQAALARGVRDWVPQLLSETALALHFAVPATTQATGVHR